MKPRNDGPHWFAFPLLLSSAQLSSLRETSSTFLFLDLGEPWPAVIHSLGHLRDKRGEAQRLEFPGMTSAWPRRLSRLDFASAGSVTLAANPASPVRTVMSVQPEHEHPQRPQLRLVEVPPQSADPVLLRDAIGKYVARLLAERPPMSEEIRDQLARIIGR